MDCIGVATALGGICIFHSVGINAHTFYICIGGIILDFEIRSFCKIRSLLQCYCQILCIRKHCRRHVVLALSVKDQNLALLWRFKAEHVSFVCLVRPGCIWELDGYGTIAGCVSAVLYIRCDRRLRSRGGSGFRSRGSVYHNLLFRFISAKAAACCGYRYSCCYS